MSDLPFSQSLSDTDPTDPMDLSEGGFDKENSTMTANSAKDASSNQLGNQLDDLLDEIESEQGRNSGEVKKTNKSTKSRAKQTASSSSSKTSSTNSNSGTLSAASPSSSASSSSRNKSSSTSSDSKQDKKRPEKNSANKAKKPAQKASQKSKAIPKFPKFPLPPGDNVSEMGGESPCGSQSQDIDDPPPVQVTPQPRPFRESAAAASSSSSSTPPTFSTPGTNKSGYDRQHTNSNVCLDVTSIKFTPDDPKRIHIVLRKMLGEPFDMPDLSYTSPNENGQEIQHNFPTVSSADVTGVPLDRAPGAAGESVDFKHFLILADFASSSMTSPTIMITVPKKDLIPFVIAMMPEHAPAGTRWELPPHEKAHDFINAALSQMYKDDIPAVSAYEKTGKWGALTLIFLQSEDIHTMCDCRRFMSEFRFQGNAFDTYPKDALTIRADVSVLLRGSMKTWDTELIPKVLFRRNMDCLAGTLRITSTFLFASQDRSHKGESKASWRRISLVGDEQFMRCLRNFPEGKPFSLGVDAVQIRGGLRPPEPPAPTLGKRQWRPTRPQSLTTNSTPHQQQQQQNQQQQQHQLQQPLIFFNPIETQASQQSNFSSTRGSTPKRGRGSRRGRGRFPRSK